jgi:hypothetical protein
MELIKSSLGTLIRHGGNAVGVWLVSQGLIDAEQSAELVNYIVGGGLIVAMGIWSIIRTKITEKLGL